LLVMAPPSQELEPPTNPGRFISFIGASFTRSISKRHKNLREMKMAVSPEPPIDDSDLPDAYRAAIEQYAIDGEDLTKTFQDSAPTEHAGVVYHYTGDVAFYEIVKSGLLRLTDFTKLNDPKEIEYGIEVGVDLLSRACAASGHPRLATFAQIFRLATAQGTSAYMRAFILSMSTARDELSQWRAYGDNANGYCLEFYASELSKAFELKKGATGGGFFLVQYDAAQLQSAMNNLVQQAIGAVTALPQGPELDAEAWRRLRR
jgi:hypothetical protein